MIQTGVRLDFVQGAPLPFRTAPPQIPAEDVEFVLQDLEKGFSTGAYCDLVDDRFVSPAFVNRQGTGATLKRRLVHNYKWVNSHCRTASCRYESAADFHRVFQPGDWLLSSDVERAYHHVAVHRHHRKYLSFHLALPARAPFEGTWREVPLAPGGRWVEIQGTRWQLVACSSAALPFGWRGSPLAWTKLMRTWVAHIRSLGIRCIILLDDLAYAVQGSKARALQAQRQIQAAFDAAGLVRQPTKGQWSPSHVLEDHLGFRVDTSSRAGRLSVPSRRCNAVRALAHQVLDQVSAARRQVDTRLLQQFAGTAVSTQLAVPSARFHLRAVFDCLHPSCARSTLTRQAVTDVRWWTEFRPDSPGNGVPLWKQPTTCTLWSDASGEVGFGAILERPSLPPCYTHGYWQASERDGLIIAHKELRAVHLALQRWREELSGRDILVFEDNMNVVRLLESGTTRSPTLMRELRAVWRFMLAHNMRLQVRYVRSEENRSDWWSRWQDRSAWTFQPPVLAAWRRRVRPTLDPFACVETAVTRRFCSRHFEPGAIAIDGFSVDWGGGERVWLSPPWQLIPRVLHKIRVDRARGVLFVPEWRSQLWWPHLAELRARWFRLPPPALCVRPLHSGVVEPFVNRAVRLLALEFDAAS